MRPLLVGWKVQQVAHALPLGAQVAQVLGVRVSLEQHALDDLQAVAVQATVLGGVVGHQPHGGDAEVDQDLRADAVLAVVHGQAELEIGVDGVAAPDRKSTRLNSSHEWISYAVFCLKKKK